MNSVLCIGEVLQETATAPMNIVRMICACVECPNDDPERLCIGGV